MMPSRWLWLAVAFLTPLPSRAADDGHLRYLPSDTRVVLTINASALAEADRKNGEALVRRVYQDRLVPELKQVERLPITDVTRLVYALPYAGTLNGLIVVRGKVDRKLFEQQMRQAMKASKRALTVESVGKPAVAVFRRAMDEKLWLDLAPPLAKVPATFRRLVAPDYAYLAAVDDQTILVSLAGKAPVERALRARPATTRPRTTEALTELLRQQSAKDVASVAILDDALHPALALVADAATRDTFKEWEHLTVRVKGGKGVEVVVAAQARSADSAAELEKKAAEVVKIVRGGLPKVLPDDGPRKALDGLFKAFAISRKNEAVTLKASLTSDEARKLVPIRRDKTKGER
jgi:hypothetical protein